MEIPDVHGQELEEVKYSGMYQTSVIYCIMYIYTSDLIARAKDMYQLRTWTLKLADIRLSVKIGK